jgi:hypothetical protein
VQTGEHTKNYGLKNETKRKKARAKKQNETKKLMWNETKKQKHCGVIF